MATNAQKQALESYLTSDNFKSDVIDATRSYPKKRHLDFDGVALEIPTLWYSAGSSLEGVFPLEREEIAQKLRIQLEAK